MDPRFTSHELSYLHSQRLGRLATVDGDGAPQNNPTAFFVDEDAGHILVGGFFMGKSRKFRNAKRNPHVALVVDDLFSTDPWVVRGVEVRGDAEALVDVDPPMPGMSRELLRITPRWIASWGVDPDQQGMSIRR